MIVECKTTRQCLFFFFNIILIMCKYKMKCKIVKHSVGGGNAHILVCQPPLNKPKKKKYSMPSCALLHVVIAGAHHLTHTDSH